jgi:hypothetical protein
VAASSTSGTAQIVPPRLTSVNEASLSLMPCAIEFQVACAQAAVSVVVRTNGEAPAAPVTAAAASSREGPFATSLCAAVTRHRTC